MFEWVRTGMLNIVIDKVFALDEAVLGHAYILRMVAVEAKYCLKFDRR